MRTSVLPLYWQVSDLVVLLLSVHICNKRASHTRFFSCSVLDSLVDPLQKTINFRPKQDAVKQEVDRNEDMVRSALRAIASLNRIR